MVFGMTVPALTLFGAALWLSLREIGRGLGVVLTDPRFRLADRARSGRAASRFNR